MEKSASVSQSPSSWAVIINLLLKFSALGITIMIGLQLGYNGYFFVPYVIYLAAFLALLSFFVDNNYSFKLRDLMFYIPFEGIFIGAVLLIIRKMQLSNTSGLVEVVGANDLLLAIGVFGMVIICRLKALRVLSKKRIFLRLQSQIK